jgi:hypothetical protein
MNNLNQNLAAALYAAVVSISADGKVNPKSNFLGEK